MTKTRLVFLSILALVLVLPFSAHAFMNKAEDSVYIAKDQTVSGTLFAAGSSITVDGKVQGDVICAGQSIVINGTVDGDVMCAGQSITINGTVGGSVRSAGNAIVIAGKVSRNVMVAGASVTLSPNASVGWDMQFASASADIRGKVGRDVDGAGASTTIAGTIGRNVFLILNDNRSTKIKNSNSSPIITSTAKIGGNLWYRSNTDANIEKGSTIGGTVSKFAMTTPIKQDTNKNTAGAWILFALISIFSSLIVGLVFVSWLKRPAKEMTDIITTKVWPSIGWGLIVTILTPIIAFIILITIIGAPLALILFVAWLFALYLSHIIFGVALGRWLMKKFAPNKTESPSLLWPMVLGIIVTTLLCSIPILGFFFCVVIMFWTIGGIWIYAKAKS